MAIGSEMKVTATSWLMLASLLAVMRLSPVMAEQERAGGAKASEVSVLGTPHEYFVDPEFTGAPQGTQSNPWTDLGHAAGSAQWTAINSALSDGPVTVYFPARMTAEDVAAETTNQVLIFRSDKSSHRLTLDGMSKYNSSEAKPQWLDYTGACKFRIRIVSASMSIGTQLQSGGRMDYTTIRGFEATGSSGRVVFGGNHTIIEHLYIHDITTVGATLQLGNAVDKNKEQYGHLTDITIRNNVIEHGFGEGIYLGCNYRLFKQGGLPEYGNAHTHILVENNVIRDSGKNGGQGDGIDCKSGILDLTIRNNFIDTTQREGAVGITVSPAFNGAENQLVIEGNVICNTETSGISLGGINGAMIRNNVIYNSHTHSGIGLTGGDADCPRNKNIEIYNNTLYDNGIGIGAADGVKIRNNLLLGNLDGKSGKVLIEYWGKPTNIERDYNLISPDIQSSFPEGQHSIIFKDLAGIVLDPAKGDFHLKIGSPAIDAGDALTAVTTDSKGVARPQGAHWDIGAFEYSDPVSSKPKP